jgi:hypothetical protein
MMLPIHAFVFDDDEISFEVCYPFVIPAQTGIQAASNRTPACAGVIINL